MTDSKKEPTLRQRIGHFAPKLVDLTEGTLFGDVWERQEMSKRDRSLITVAALTALYRTNELPIHIKKARENGVTEEELVELMTHLAFYAGWPCAVTGVNLLLST